MHDLATIQRMNREATERANEEARAQREARLAAITEPVTEADEVEAARKAAMQRHPAGSARRITEPAIDATTEPARPALKGMEIAMREVAIRADENGQLTAYAATQAVMAALAADRAQRA